MEQQTRITAAQWWSKYNAYIEMGFDERQSEESVNFDFYCPNSELIEEV